MKCSKCGKEVDDKLLICPNCESILHKDKEGYHHNYATKSIELGAAKLTEEVIDPEYDLNVEKRNSISPLFKNSSLMIINIIVLFVLGLGLFLLSVLILEKITIWIIFSILIIVLIVGISILSYEGLFYKAYKNPFYGLIPFYRLYVMFSISNEIDRLETTKKLMGIVMGYGIYCLATISPMYFYMFPLFHAVFYAMTFVSIIVYLKVRINVLGDLSSRFNLNEKTKVLTIIFPFVRIAIYAFSNKFYYTKLSDSYL